MDDETLVRYLVRARVGNGLRTFVRSIKGMTLIARRGILSIHPIIVQSKAGEHCSQQRQQNKDTPDTPN